MYRNREDFEHLEHRLGNSAYDKSPYPRFYQGVWSEPERPFQTPPFHERQVQNDARSYFDNNCALWIGNLDPRISETILFELFCQVGSIRNITFPATKPDFDLSTRFCFVNFMIPDSVPRAIEMMQGTVLFGRKLYLKYRPNSIHAFQASKFHQPNNTQRWNKTFHIPVSNHASQTKLPSVLNCNEQQVVPATKEPRETSNSMSSDQDLTLESEDATKKYSPVRPPYTSQIDVVVGSPSPFKAASSMKFSRKSPYYFNAAQARARAGRAGPNQNRKVYIKPSPATLSTVSLVKISSPPPQQPESKETHSDKEYDPTDPEIR